MANDIDRILEKIRSGSPFNNEGSSRPKPKSILKDTDSGKQSFQEYTPYSTESLYARTSSGERIPLTPGYIAGTDNVERYAQNQSTSDKWLNGLQKLGIKTATAAIGGTVGVVGGVIEGISKGSWDAVYDNSFMKTLEDINVKADTYLPNYYTKEEKDKGFFDSATTANFWANDVLGGISFVTGAIVSEALWAAATGGASLAMGGSGRLATKLANAGKWGKATLGEATSAKSLAKLKDIVGTIPKNFANDVLNKDAAIYASKASKLFNGARFVTTSSGYEASVEAFHYKKEATENFFRTFKDLNGREPNNEDISEFTNNLSESANAVFAANMAVLAPSNLAMFGSMFRIKSPLKGVTQALDKKLFGIGIEETVDEAGKSAFKALQATKGQKIFSGAFAVSKPILMEGVWEEGGQAVITKTASNWIESSYNPKYNNVTMDMMDATYKAMADTYGTKEGWKEMGIGAIIGGGMSIVQGKGKPIELVEIQQERKAQEEIANKHNTFTVVQGITAKRVMMNAKMQSAVEQQKVAETKGDYVSAQLAQNDVLLSEMEFRHEIGENINDLYGKYETALNGVSAEEWVDAGIENVDEYKQTILEGYKDLLSRFKKNTEFAEAVYGSTPFSKSTVENHLSKQALAFALTKGETAGKVMDTVLTDIGNVIGVERAKALTVEAALSTLGKNIRSKIYRRNSKISALEQKQTSLLAKIRELQATPNDRVSGTELGDTTEALIKVQQDLESLRVERENNAKEISEEVNRIKGIKESSVELNKEVITASDLENIEKNLEDIDNVIYQYKGRNPQLYAELIDLTSQYKSAKENFINHQIAAVGLTNGNLKIKTDRVAGWMGKIFNPKAPMDKFTEDFLTHFATQKILDETELGRDIIDSRIGGVTETVTEAEMQASATEDNGRTAYTNISEERLTIIAQKIRTNQPLSNRELILQRANKAKIDAEIAKLNEELGTPIVTSNPVQNTVQLTELEILYKRLSDAFSARYIPMAYIGTDARELIKEKPTKEDIEEYRTLVNEPESPRKEYLRTKLQNWRMLDSATVGGQSLADMIELIDQLETVAEQKDTISQVSEEDIPLITDTNFNKSSEKMNVYDILQNPLANVTVKFLNDGKLEIAHMHIGEFAYSLGASLTIINSKGKPVLTTPENIEKYRYEKGAQFTLIPSGSTGGIKFESVGNGNYQIKEQDFYGNQQVLGLTIVNSGNSEWSWKDVYYWNGAEFVEKPSDYKNDKLTGNGYELFSGDEVELYYDHTDEYSQKQVEKFEKGLITKDELRDSITIYIRKNGKNYGLFKANRGDSTTQEFMNIRNVAVELAIAKTTSSFGTVQVSHLFKGSPKFNINEKGQITNYNFNNDSIKEVVTTGYMQDGLLVLSDKSFETKSDVSFVKGVSTANKGKKVPLIILNKSGHFIAYPVSMIATPTPRGAEVDKILSNPALGDMEMVKAINRLQIESGISPSVHGLVDLTDEAKINAIKEDLDNYSVFTTADDLADVGYNKNSLINDAMIQINLEDLNRAISAPKVKVSLETTQMWVTKDIKYKTLSELNDMSSDLSIEVFRKLVPKGGIPSNYVNSKGKQIEDDFTEVFDDIVLDPKEDSEIQKNKNILLQAYEAVKNKRTAKRFLGEVLMNKIEDVVNRLENIKSLTSTNIDEIVKKSLTCKN